MAKVGVAVAVGAVLMLMVVAVGMAPGWAFAFAVLVFVAGVSLRFPAFALLTVLPAAYGARRLGPGGANLSVADAALLVGAFAAAPFVPLDSPRLRRILGGIVAYESMIALAVLAHPTLRAAVEWGHRILIVAGAVLVGSALARLGRHGAAIRIYLGASAVVAFSACLYSVTHHLSAAYPFGIQKNAAGLLLAFAFLITIFAPGLASVPARLLCPLRGLLLVGMLAAQSRGAMLAIIVVLAAAQLRGQNARRVAPFVLITALAMGAVTVLVTQKQDARARTDPSSARFYGLGARQSVDTQALEIWSHEPLLGSGLRYFRDPAFRTSEPHSVVVVSLAETGLIGVAGLAVLLGTAWSAVRRLGGEMAKLARLAFIVSVLAGLFDIFWVAGRGSLPWMLLGFAVGIPATRVSETSARAR